MNQDKKTEPENGQQEMEATVEYDLDTCTRCMACVTSCPTKCLEDVNGDPKQVRPQDCIKCGNCESICPVGAVKLKK
ncbi:MAG: 4Fe-4S dicluster domain-containing protein [Candidatus Moranbacteria bacterium]|nr:4Fe-4S dicluster domain-containing protein [Candidatus Moranbacteria bacterium]